MRKSRLVLLWLCIHLIPLATIAQGNYQINGQVISDKNITRAYLYTFNKGRELLDSAEVKNNTFQFSGQVDKIQAASIGLKGSRRSVYFILEPAQMQVRLQEDWNQPSTVIGGIQNAIKKGYELDIASFQDSMRALGAAYEHADEDGKVKLGMQMQVWNQKVDSVRRDYLRAHPASLAVLDIYRPYIPGMNYVELQELVNRIDRGLAYAPVYQELLGIYERKKERNLVGQQAPAIHSKTIAGKTFDLTSLKGKTVLIDFWASWCAPCRIANRKLVPTYEKYRSKGFEIVSVSMDDKVHLWKAAVEKDGIPWIQVADLIDLKSNKAAAAYHVEQLPTLFLIDENGIVVKQNMNHEELLEFLKLKYDE